MFADEFAERLHYAVDRHWAGELERRLTTHDRAITELIEAIRQLMTSPEPKKKRPIGFASLGTVIGTSLYNSFAPWEK